MRIIARLDSQWFSCYKHTHATPAPFVAHQINRDITQEIVTDCLISNIDVFIGSGRNDFEKIIKICQMN